MRYYHTTLNGAQFKTCKSFISGIFHLLLSESLLTMVTGKQGRKSKSKGGLVYLPIAKSVGEIENPERKLHLKEKSQCFFAGSLSCDHKLGVQETP